MSAGGKPLHTAHRAFWKAPWFDHVATLQMRAWRAVEAQHLVATMRLADSLEEQALLEQILEDSKPPLPPAAEGRHFLLSTPFRYRSPFASRFRVASSPGIWYGAQTVAIACAETAYWRWRFVTESHGLRDTELLTEHTVFAATLSGEAIDLTAAPWSRSRSHWVHPSDYTATQALATAARAHSVQWLRYESSRATGGTCCAVLEVQALQNVDLRSQQTWHCRATRWAVRMIHANDRHEWAFEP